ncbi:DNA repair protein rev1, partial [Globisporangium splendens]
MWMGAPRDGGAAKKRKPQTQLGEHHGGSFGVYVAHKIQKLRNQNDALTSAVGTPSSSSRDKGSGSSTNAVSALFDSVHVFVDGYTVPSREEIRRLALMHGGGFEHYETSRVTHIIATHLPPSKLLQYKKMRKPPPVLHPNWIVQSIEQGKLLPVKPFLYQGFGDPTQSSLFSLSASSVALSSSSLASPTVVSKQEHSVENRSKTTSALETPGEDHPPMNQIDLPENIDPLGNGEYERLSSNDDSEADLPHQFAHDPVNDNTSPETSASRELRHPTAVARPPSSNTRYTSTRDGPEQFARHFFAKSRLHHIGNWRSTFQQKSVKFLSIYKGHPIDREPPSSSRRVILHVDMDCFFVAVAVRERPELQNVPVAVAHSGSSGTSEVSSCNYLARAKGIRAGMYMQIAKELYPELVVLPYKFEEIEQVSFQIYHIFFSHTPYVQAMSCDEALLEFGAGTDGVELATRIRSEIFAQTQCPASVGVSYNILLAKMASKEAKPDGIYQITSPEQAEPFLLSLQIGDLPGVGRQMSAKLCEFGLKSIPQLRSFSKSELARCFGKNTSDMLANFARGVDTRPLSIESNTMRKSVSAVVNFGIRFDKWEDATAFLMALAEELQARLRSLKVQTRCVTLLIKKRREGEPLEPSKYMGHGVCDNFSKSQVFAEPTDDDLVIGKACIELLRQLHLPTTDLRGVGMQATKLVRASTTSSSKNTRQLFKAWLSESQSRQQDDEMEEQEVHNAGQKQTSDEREDEKAPDERNAARPSETRIGLSQVNMDVLEELPSWLRDEVLATYSRHSHSSRAGAAGEPAARLHPPEFSLRQAPTVGSKGKKPLQKPPRSRNLFDSSRKATDAVPQRTHSQAGNANALDDIRMSQIDSDVYYALPFTLRKEIDRHAKKSETSCSVKAVKAPAAPPIALESNQTLVRSSKELPPIEDLFQNLLEIVNVAVEDEDNPTSQTEAFDAIYTRILMEVERHTLDRAVKMLRYVRRKCDETKTSAMSRMVLRNGFNRVLSQVNQDLRHHFRGVLSTKSITLL